MKKMFVLAAMAALLAFPLLTRAADEEGFKSIFDGKTLEGWDGNPDFWSVQDGCIVGQTTAEKPTGGNTFLVWRGGKPADFVLKLEYKLRNHNSGVQYRSFEVPNEKWVMGGYQADIEESGTYSGILYGERYRGILAQRGQKTVIGDNHQPKVVGQIGDGGELLKKIDLKGWNTYEIVCKGNKIVQIINGQPMVEVTDEDKEARFDGLIGLQLHAGPAMRVDFRNIKLKEFPVEKK